MFPLRGKSRRKQCSSRRATLSRSNGSHFSLCKQPLCGWPGTKNGSLSQPVKGKCGQLGKGQPGVLVPRRGDCGWGGACGHTAGCEPDRPWGLRPRISHSARLSPGDGCAGPGCSERGDQPCTPGLCATGAGAMSEAFTLWLQAPSAGPRLERSGLSLPKSHPKGPGACAHWSEVLGPPCPRGELPSRMSRGPAVP